MGMAGHRVQKRIDRELRKPRDLVQKPRARLPRYDGVSDLELPFPQVGFDLLETKFDALVVHLQYPSAEKPIRERSWCSCEKTTNPGIAGPVPGSASLMALERAPVLGSAQSRRQNDVRRSS